MASIDGEALIVKAGGARFALPMARIAEVRGYTKETRVPGLPPAILGIVERNGKPVHVLDPARRLSNGNTIPGSRACLVFFDRVAGRGEGAMLVEEVERIVEHGADETAAPLDIDALFATEQP